MPALFLPAEHGPLYAQQAFILSLKKLLPAVATVLCICGEYVAAAAPATRAIPAFEEVVVEGKKVSERAELGLSTIEISGDELVTKLGATLGETLANEPGVHNASYGPGVGLPVLRGLSGVRVRLSEDGIGAWDASSISPDHATAIEPVLAKKIQVVKGAATVIHGNNAIGGIVEVTHGRIAEALTGQAVSSVFEARKELENDHERESYVGKVNTELGKFVFQLDGFTRHSNDMSIPGVAIEEAAIEQVFGISNSDNTFGTVLNSDANSHSGSAALSFVDDNFFIGGASTKINSEYGLPPGAHTEPPDSPGHSHSHPVGDNIAVQARVRVDLKQDRHLFKLGGVLGLSQLESYQVTVGKIEYTHREFELDPLTDRVVGGTRFYNDVLEAKAEINHSLLSFANEQHSGRFGVQWIDREFMAKSERIFGGEDYVPATEQQTFGFFMYEQFPLSRGSAEIGARYEWQQISQRELTAPLLPNNTQFFHQPITYQTYTVSSAVSLDVTDQQRVIVNVNSAQRAPEIQELLSLGPHLATRSYDIGLLLAERKAGEAPPQPETLNSVEIQWQWQSKIGELNSSLFYTQADDFIYQQRQELDGLFDIAAQQFRPECTRLEQCIAVFRYTQNEVTFAGYEWQWRLPAVEFYSGDVQIEFFGDFVRGKITNGGDLPRMPPSRNGIDLKWINPNINAGLRYTRVAAQNNPGTDEAPTDGYAQLDANISYTHHFSNVDHQDVMIFLQMKNLLNEDIRKSTSFLRNFTPEPGREISLGLRYQF